MFLPIGDTPNPKTTPYITWLLIGINVAVFVAVTLPLSLSRPDLNDPALVEYLKLLGARGNLPVQVVYEHVSAYDLVVFKYGFRPAEFSLLSMFSAMFMHAGFMHLAGNMLFLWIYGDNVEHRLGHFGFLLAYLGTGLVATLFFAMFVPDSQVPMLGASGAISGVLGLYFLWFPRNQVKVFIFLFPLIMTTVLIPARIVLGVYLVLDNLLPFLTTSADGGGVAHGAHIGGFLAGLGLAFAADRAPGLMKSGRRASVGKRPRVDDTDAATDIAAAIERGDLPRAADQFVVLDNRSLRDRLTTAQILAVGESLLDRGAASQALSLFRRLIAERPNDRALDRAFLGAGRAMLHRDRCETAAWHYFLAAIDHGGSSEVADQARRYLKMIETHCGSTRD